MRQITGLNELREQGRMTWIEQEHGWVAAPEEIVKALSKEGFEECQREMTTSRRDRRPAGGVWHGVETRTGSVASAIWVNRPAWHQAIVAGGVWQGVNVRTGPVDIEETQGHAVNYPVIGDPELKVAKAYDMLPESAGSTAQGRTAADNATVRSVFVIGPDKKAKAMIVYPMSTGRNFDEVLRLLDSCQLTAKHTVATPVNWKPGQDVIIPTSVSDEEAKKKYPQGFKTLKPYLRTVAQPR